MRQQINLYRAQFPKVETIKVPKKWSLIAIAVAVFLFSGLGYGLWKIEGLKKDFELELESKKIAENSLNRLKQVIQNSSNEDRSKLALMELKSEAKRKQAMLTRLEEEDHLMPVSFAERFVAIARQDIPGVWLQEVKLDDYGSKITFVGETGDPKLVTRYFQKLGEEPTFKGVTFTVFNFGDTESGESTSGNAIRFVVSTDPLPVDQMPDALTMMLGKMAPK